ncbi:MAG: OmpL47-type beta-barrel domain-containing protein [Bacteroidota bacterium]
MLHRLAAFVVLILIVFASVFAVQAGSDAAERGVAWLVSRQRPDGSFGQRMDIPATALTRAAMARRHLTPAGWINLPPPEMCNAWELCFRAWAMGEPETLDRLVSLQSEDGSWLNRIDLTALAAMALRQGGRANEAAVAYLSTWSDPLPPSPDPFDLALTGLSLHTNGRLEDAARLGASLERAQWSDGSWMGDAAVTALALRCLADCLPASAALMRGRAFLSDRMHEDGSVAPRFAETGFTTSLAAFCLEDDPLVERMLNNLIAKGEPGFIPQIGAAVRDTAAVVQTLKLFPEQARPVSSAQAWLGRLDRQDLDARAARLLAADLTLEEKAAGLELLYAMRAAGGGFGLWPEELANPVDTAAALAVLAAVSPEDARRQQVEAVLLAMQKADGGWGLGQSSDPYLTALVCQTLRPEVEAARTALTRALDYLTTLKQPDGSYGSDLHTALAGLALRLHGRNVDGAEAYLAGRQREDGSWGGDIFTTAAAVRFLNLFQNLPNLSSREDAIPELVQGEQIRLAFMVRNDGKLPVYNIVVRLWEGVKGNGGTKLGGDRLLLGLDPGETETLTLDYLPQRIGALTLGLEIDPEAQIPEYNETDNLVYATATVLPPTPAGFAATPNDGEVHLRWNAPPNVAGLTGYELIRDGAVIADSLPLAAAEYRDAGLQNGEEHEYALVLRAGGLKSWPAVLRAAAVRPPDGIDLCLKDLRIIPGSDLHVGQTAKIVATVENRGATAAAEFPVRLYLGDQTTGTPIGSDQIIANLAYAETRAVTVAWTPAEARPSVDITAIVDPDKTLIDLDRANNLRKTYASVVEAANLVVTPGDISIATEYHNHPGTPYYSWMMWGGATVVNKGKAPAGPFDVRIHGLAQSGYESNANFIRCDGLAPGQSFYVPIPWQDAFYAVFVQIDGQNEIPESDESDNIAGRAVPGVANGVKAYLLSPQTLVVPQAEKSTILRLCNYLSQPVTLDLNPQCPSGLAVTGASQITVSPGGTMDVPFLLRAEGEGDFAYRIAATGVTSQPIMVKGLVLARFSSVKILSAEVTPGCLESGETGEVYGRLFNAANWLQRVYADMIILDSEGKEVWRRDGANPIQVMTRADESPVSLGSISTGGLLPGDYRVRISLRDAEGNTMAGAAAEAVFAVGSRLSISRTVSADILPPGDSQVELRIGTEIKTEGIPEFPERLNAAFSMRGARVWGGQNALYINDASISTNANVGNSSHGQPVVIELLRNSTINLYQIYLSTSSPNSGYKIESSLDGVNWRVDVDRSTGRYTGWRAEPITPRVVRYIRVCGYYGGNTAQIGEFRALTGSTPIANLPPFEVDTLIENVITGAFNACAPGIADIDRDGVPEIVASSHYYLYVFDGQTGALEWSIFRSDSSTATFSPLLGDIDGDNQAEVVVYRCQDGWPPRFYGSYVLSSVGQVERSLAGVFDPVIVSDLEGDRVPELVTRSRDWNWNCSLLACHSDGSIHFNVGGRPYSRDGSPIALDIDNDGAMEIFDNLGDPYAVLYETNGQIQWQLPNPHDPRIGPAYSDSCAVDLNKDGRPEVVTAYERIYNVAPYMYGLSCDRDAILVALDKQGCEIWRHTETKASLGELLISADFNNDGTPDILYSFYPQGSSNTVYLGVISGIDGSQLWQRSKSSGVTLVVFDYDADSVMEVIYTDTQPGLQSILCALDGRDGSVEGIYRFPSNAGPYDMRPVDVDADGHLELVMTLTVAPYQLRMWILGDPTWVPARSIWSGDNYHVTDITDDLKIPIQEQPSWVVHNTYRVQSSGSDHTTSYALTVDQDLAPDAIVVPDSPVPAPLSQTADKIVWYHRLADSGPASQAVGCTLQLTGLQPGRVYEVTGETRVTAKWDGGTREIVLSPVTVAVEHACWLERDRVSVAEYGQAEIGVWIKNHRGTSETFTVQILGLPEGWAEPSAPVTLASGEKRLVIIKANAPYGANEGVLRFTAVVEGDQGMHDTVSGEFVVESAGRAALTLAQYELPPAQHLLGLAEMDNGGAIPLDLQYILKVTDRAGTLVRSIAAGEFTVAAGEGWERSIDSSPGTMAPGDYSLVLEVYRAGLLFRRVEEHFTILPERNLTLTLAADRSEYGPGADARIIATFTNSGRNAAYDDLACKLLIVAPSGETVQETNYPGPYLAPAASEIQLFGWHTGAHPAGTYRARLVIFSSGQELATAECAFTVREGTAARELLTGTLDVDPRVVKGPMAGTIAWSVTNQGNTSISAQAELVLAGAEEQILAEEPISLAPGESQSFTHAWDPPYTPGDYIVMVRVRRGEEVQPIALGGYAALPYDITPPETTLSYSKDPVAVDGKEYVPGGTSFILTATDDESGVGKIRYRLDEGGEQEYTEPVALSPGPRLITYWAVDKAGNPENAKSAAVYCDAVAPVTTADAPAGWQKAPVTLMFIAADEGSGVAETLHAVGNEAPGNGTTRIIENEGTHSVRYWSKDRVGNIEAEKTATVRIDITPPVIKLNTEIQAAYPVGQAVALDWEALDSLSGVAARSVTLDSVLLTGSGFTVTPGDHVLVLRAADAAGNEVSIERSFRGKYLVSIEVKPESWNQNTGTFTVTINGLPSGYTAAGIAWAACDGASAEEIKAAGDKVILKFRRDDVTMLPLDTTFVLTGQFTDGVWFEGVDTVIKVK